MSRLGNHLVYDLLELADSLVAQRSGRSNLQKVFRRRAISSAYYALFHALSYVCVEALIGWGSDSDILDPLYRNLDHSIAKKRLTSAEAGRIGPTLGEIGAAFARLQDKRHSADYGPPSLSISAPEALDLIDQARQVISELERMNSTQRKKLAVLLIAKPR